MKLIDRINFPILMLFMVILTIIYSVVMLFFWPIYFIGGLFWKFDTFHKMMDSYYDSIPRILENNKP